MSNNEWIELILLRSCGETGHPHLERFERSSVVAIRLELILGWLLTEKTVPGSDGGMLDSKIVCTPAGERRREVLEEMVDQEKDDLARWIHSR